MMRARWVFNDLTPELPGVGMATVASWWPGKYWLVSTVQLDEASVKNYGSSTLYPFVEFTQPKSIYGFSDVYDTTQAFVDVKISVPIGKAVPRSGKFITQIFKCRWISVYCMDLPTRIVSPQSYCAQLRPHTDRTCNVDLLELPLFEREYSDLSEARAGHKETVDLLVRGHLGLRTQQTPNYESTMTNKTKTPKPRGILLIVDYEDGPRESLGIIFKHEYDLLMARDGPTAIEHAKQHDIDVVVTEINMAGMSGIELLERLKLLKPDIEVIMMTGLETTDTFRESLRLGACDFINKPFDIATIRSAVSKAMQRRRLETK